MWQAVSTELAGWREALTDQSNILSILIGVVVAAVVGVTVVFLSAYAGPDWAIGCLVAASVMADLLALRMRGRL